MRAGHIVPDNHVTPFGENASGQESEALERKAPSRESATSGQEHETPE